MKFFLTFLTFTFLLINSIKPQVPFRVVFYNVENFFDTEDQPGKDDADFLPDGIKHWTYGKYLNKLNNISKVITAIGEWGSPAIVGMCEVENDKVMLDLTRHSPLKTQKYQYVITNNEDPRGINVALMFQRDQFRYLWHENCKIYFPDNPDKTTRDILYVSGTVLSGDTLDVFVCHFPSRRGGERESEYFRFQAAKQLRLKVDSLNGIRQNSNIIIMGDFNDEPSNSSIYEVLGAKKFENESKKGDLCNLFYKFENMDNKGSYKFRSTWNVLDQIIVSENLINENVLFNVLPQTATIFGPKFLLIEDKTNGGKRPKKTYSGMKHEGGFSDHLPVFVDFLVTSQE